MIRLYGDEALRDKELQPVTEFDDKLSEFVNEMINTMYKYDGRGLSANQMGVLEQIFVMDHHYKINDKGEKTGQHPQVIINPRAEYIDPKRELPDIIDFNEACLSIPGVSAITKRYSHVILYYQDLNGNSHHIVADGLEAIVIQHEMDHLAGGLFIDHLKPLKKQMVIAKFLKGIKRFVRSGFVSRSK